MRLKKKSIKIRLDHFYRDLLIIFAGILVTIVAVQFGIIEQILSYTEGQTILGSFIAGLFFTSVFTIAPASIVLAELSEVAPVTTVALWGGLGAMFGDLVLFLFIRDIFAYDLNKYLRKHHARRFFSYFHFGFLRWLYPVLGAIIIISPLPDEFGLTLMGLSKIPLAIMLPLLFVMNFIGILLISMLGAYI
ncbi:MAG TPA: hypothetical protein VD928_03670 [Candidatus Paceibacterota bacterium]|nr:hypothetical protein [Candidatus Paceibacterota bacterium]